MDNLIDSSIMQEMRTNKGSVLLEITKDRHVLLVFLRHFGCVFCKEALSDLTEIRAEIEEKGVEIIFVHMANNNTAGKYFKEFGLEGVQYISDPEKKHYIAFGLRKGSFSQLYGLRTWMRGFSPETKKYKLELAQHLGDSTQMPGIFLLHKGEVVESYIHRLASDRPDYQELLAQCHIT